VTIADDVSPGKQSYRVASFDGLLGKAIASGRTINATDVAAVQHHFQAVPSTRSEFIVPISDADSIIGLLNSDAEAMGHFYARHAGRHRGARSGTRAGGSIVRLETSDAARRTALGAGVIVTLLRPRPALGGVCGAVR